MAVGWRAGRGLLWAAFAAQVIVLSVGFVLTDLTIDLLSIVLLALPVAVCGAIAFLYRDRADAPRIAIAAEGIAFLAGTLAVGELITYAAGAANLASVEHRLRAVDLALGFDWFGYAAMIDSAPWLCAALGYAYDAFNVQFIAVIAVLVVSAKIERLQAFLLATFAALALTCLLFLLFPAATQYHMLGDATATLTNLYPSALDHHVGTLIKLDDAFAHLRDGSLRHVAAQDLVGLIAFPSFHTCAAILFVWGMWDVRALRLPAVMLNLTMVAATPLYGGHYLADVIGGVALTAVSIIASRRAVAWVRARPPHPIETLSLEMGH